MEYRNIGKTDLTISEIGFGCGNNAVLMVKAPYEEQVKAVRRALDSGINYFDTAYAYGRGKSEENLGKILNELGAKAVVSTKIRIEADDLGDIKGATIRAGEEALKRLQRDRLDLVQLHTRVALDHGMGRRFTLTPRDVLGPGGVLEGFQTLKDRGLVDFFGFSGLGDVQALHQLVDSGGFHAFQAYYNLLNPSAGQPVPPGFSALDYGMIIDRAAKQGMGIFIIRILAAGALTANPEAGGGSSPEPLSPGSDYSLDLQRADIIKSALGVDGAGLTRAAIGFGLMKKEVSTVLVGFSNMAHIDEAAACSGLSGLSDVHMNKLKTLWKTDFGKLKED